ncbi:MAG TPA: hypothetical protein ENK85_10830 [Saprospiraceae bacterium]|nr:hypothetical protein [Saprospiraceae bacterium]
MVFQKIFILLIFSFGLQAQDVIPVTNGSFEGENNTAATIPQGWSPCRMGTTPDLLPGSWGVYTIPAHGATYVGLITRDDGSYESIGQRLAYPMLKGNCYSFSLDLAHSKTYSGYNLPIRLRVWAGKSICAKDQLLWESDLIYEQNWHTFEIRFLTKNTYQYLIIEAYFAPGVFIKYRGNVLIDHITDIVKCDRA